MQTKVRYHKTSLVLAGLSCLLALAVLFGWWFQISFLVRGFSTLAPMQLSSALLFFLLGLCLLLQIVVPGRILALICLIGSLFSLLVLLPYLGGPDFKVDALIDHAHSSNRMSASAALTFFMLFLGCAFYNMRVNTGKLWISCSLGGLSFVTGLASVIGYLAMLDIDYGWIAITHMTLLTAIGFILTGASLVLSALRTEREGKISAWVLIPFLLSTITLTFFLWRGIQLAQTQALESGATSQINFFLLALLILSGLISIRLLKASVDLTVKLENTSFEAKFNNQSKANILYYVSHELKSPLSAVLGFSEVYMMTRKFRERLKRPLIVSIQHRCI